VKSIVRRRPSPALVIALIALFVSLSGAAYGVATGSIDSREIKDNALRSRDLRNNDIRTRDLRNNEVRGLDIRNSTVHGRDVALDALTGDDVDESELGKVASATTADSAQSLDGLRVVPIRHRSAGGTNETVLDTGGLQLLVTCAAGDEELSARTSVAGGEIAFASSDVASANPGLNGDSDDDFNPGEPFDLQTSASAAGDRVFQLHYLGGNGTDVTAHLIADDEVGGSNCLVSGYAVVAG
jgi:hypothetical protein